LFDWFDNVKKFKKHFTCTSMASVGVIIEGSMKGLGRCGDELAGVSTTREAHCFGRPTNLFDELSKPV
jgi:hypothetical protein